jgi:hypothetical protein
MKFVASFQPQAELIQLARNRNNIIYFALLPPIELMVMHELVVGNIDMGVRIQDMTTSVLVVNSQIKINPLIVLV